MIRSFRTFMEAKESFGDWDESGKKPPRIIIAKVLNDSLKNQKDSFLKAVNEHLELNNRYGAVFDQSIATPRDLISALLNASWSGQNRHVGGFGRRVDYETSDFGGTSSFIFRKYVPPNCDLELRDIKGKPTPVVTQEVVDRCPWIAKHIVLNRRTNSTKMVWGISPGYQEYGFITAFPLDKHQRTQPFYKVDRFIDV